MMEEPGEERQPTYISLASLCLQGLAVFMPCFHAQCSMSCSILFLFVWRTQLNLFAAMTYVKISDRQPDQKQQALLVYAADSARQHCVSVSRLLCVLLGAFVCEKCSTGLAPLPTLGNIIPTIISCWSLGAPGKHVRS